MKIKVQPDDFIVEEIIDLPISKSGPHTVIRLDKQSWNTLDVIDFVSRRLAVSPRLFARAGLKDRHSKSTQFLTFRGRFPGAVVEKNFSLVPIGRSAQALSPKFLIGNKFTLTLRGVDDREAFRIGENIPAVNRYGVANYFDDQRFGSIRHHQGFFAKKLLLEHFKGALKLLLCYPAPEDRAELKRFKKCCRENWGAWDRCTAVPREYRPIIDYLLRHPRDFKEAIKCVDRELLNLYLLAYQSYIFNRSLYLLIKDGGLETHEVPYQAGSYLFYGRLKTPETLASAELPMVCEKTRPEGAAGEKIKEVMQEEGIDFKQFALRKMRFRGVRFKPFMRRAVVYPRDMTVHTEEPDDRYPGKKKIRIEFVLPPGSYATIIIKRLLL